MRWPPRSPRPSRWSTARAVAPAGGHDRLPRFRFASPTWAKLGCTPALSFWSPAMRTRHVASCSRSLADSEAQTSCVRARDAANLRRRLNRAVREVERGEAILGVVAPLEGASLLELVEPRHEPARHHAGERSERFRPRHRGHRGCAVRAPACVRAVASVSNSGRRLRILLREPRLSSDDAAHRGYRHGPLTPAASSLPSVVALRAAARALAACALLGTCACSLSVSEGAGDASADDGASAVDASPVGDPTGQVADAARGLDAGLGEGSTTTVVDGGLDAEGGRSPAAAWVMGYYYGRDDAIYPVSAIEWGAMTHVAAAFYLPQPDGTLDETLGLDAAAGPALAGDLVAAAHAKGVERSRRSEARSPSRPFNRRPPAPPCQLSSRTSVTC